MRILAVDDCAANRRLLRAQLEGEGLAVVEAADGVEALEILAREPIDAVISDILMPRMDGFRLCHEVRRRESLHTLPFIVYTATYSSPADEQLCLDLGADRYLRKPAAPAAILAALDEAAATTRHAPADPRRVEDAAPMERHGERLVAKLGQKSAELAAALTRLRANEQKLQLIIQSEPECVKVVAPDGRLLDMNPAGLAMLEAGSIDELRGRPIDEAVAPEYREAFRRLHERVIAGGAGTLEFEAVGLRGARRWLETHAVPLREEGRVTALLGITRDVTARRRAETALVEREQQLRLFVEHSPAAIAMFDRDMKYLIVSRRWLSDYRLEAQDVLGRSHYEVFPDLPERWKEVHRRCLAGAVERSDADPFPRDDGSLDWVRWEIRPWRAAGGAIGGLMILSEVITEQFQAQAALKVSEGRYRRLVESGSIGVIIANFDGRIREANDCFLQTVGYSREDLAAGRLDWPALTPPGWEAVDERASTQLKASGICDPFEKEYVHRDGHRVPVSLRAALLDESPGDCLCLVADISERKRAEQAVRDSERRLRRVIDGLGPHTFVGLIALDGTVLEVNRPALDAAGARLQDVRGKPVQETPWVAGSSAAQPQVRAAVARAAAGEPSRFDVEIQVAGGAPMWIDLTVQPLLDDSGRVAHVVASANVIDERKRAEAALREKERLLSESQRVAKVGSWSIELPGWQATWSEETYRIYGVSHETFVPTVDTFPDLVHPDDRCALRGWTRACLAGESPPGIEFRAVNPDGSSKVLYSRGELVVDGTGRPVRLIGTVQDVTERKQAELDLQALSGRLLRAQDEERRRLARELHDSTAQLLAALGMNLAVLARGAAVLDPGQRALLADCEALAQRGTTELRTLSYLLHPPALDSLGLARAIQDYAQGFAQRSGLDVRLNLAEDLARLPEGIELTLFRVVQESLGNVHRHARARQVSIRLAGDAESVAIEIRDDGCGVPEPAPGAVTTSTVGVGIAGMRERVRLLGGSLEIERCEPGTRVRATLPVPGNA